jgi:hypothetical protein
MASTEQGMRPGPLGDPDYRWGLEAVLRQALVDLDNGGHALIVASQVERALAVLKAGAEA